VSDPPDLHTVAGKFVNHSRCAICTDKTYVRQGISITPDGFAHDICLAASPRTPRLPIPRTPPRARSFPTATPPDPGLPGDDPDPLLESLRAALATKSLAMPWRVDPDDPNQVRIVALHPARNPVSVAYATHPRIARELVDAHNTQLGLPFDLPEFDPDNDYPAPPPETTTP
jgi:hypothetical protein